MVGGSTGGAGQASPPEGPYVLPTHPILVCPCHPFALSSSFHAHLNSRSMFQCGDFFFFNNLRPILPKKSYSINERCTLAKADEGWGPRTLFFDAPSPLLTHFPFYRWGNCTLPSHPEGKTALQRYPSPVWCTGKYIALLIDEEPEARGVA